MTNDPGQVVQRLRPVLVHERRQRPVHVELVHVLNGRDFVDLIELGRVERLEEVTKGLSGDIAVRDS